MANASTVTEWLVQVGDRARRAREDAALEVGQVADRAGVPRSVVIRMEKGGGVDLVRFWRVADALGVAVVDLLVGPGDAR